MLQSENTAAFVQHTENDAGSLLHILTADNNQILIYDLSLGISSPRKAEKVMDDEGPDGEEGSVQSFHRLINVFFFP